MASLSTPTQEQTHRAPRNMMEEGGKADSEADPCPISLHLDACVLLPQLHEAFTLRLFLGLHKSSHLGTLAL